MNFLDFFAFVIAVIFDSRKNARLPIFQKSSNLAFIAIVTLIFLNFSITTILIITVLAILLYPELIAVC